MGNITIECFRGIPPGFQFVSQFNGSDLGTDKHQHGIKILGFKDAGQGIQLMGALYHPETLPDGICRGGFQLNGHLFGRFEVAACNRPYGRGHGGGEKGHLMMFRCLFKNPFYIINKTHAQHFISFIQNQAGQFVKL